ncbi:hypothetical protein SLINC_4386 [Streptomyces lincolnensis]|uniref:Uncharacterized protein n=1 Tax=Streptomyces lincolnensis TaxID=1915 RepID=A0A1B1MDB5_STRLN|nr:hypothetical protein [Streptomyces lincolnensis]ANS66610.1 hypothetical protein SLINC_4386 [Streptomyces lincolnensis]AXG55480.1 hypothetical protein SLCG_4325 [Streptomyces lincolnensis]QMV08020.1 hypothetical protein GJU35_21750 [Streptomyces lincolnensis]
MAPPRVRTASVPRVRSASVLALSALLTTTACSALSTPPTAQKPDYAPTTAAPTPKKSAPATPPGPAALTAAQAQAALVTEADLGEPWMPTQGAATWHDGLLKATTRQPDCRRLLDTLYAEEPFGADTPARAVIGLDDVWNESQLRHQVITRPPAELDRTLAWLRTLPQKCARFTATTGPGYVQGVQVVDAGLPEVGDARQGLRVVLTGETPEGEPTVLTMDLVVVRVGDDALGLTHGGLSEVSADVTQAAVQLGAQRLTEVRRTGRVQV